MRFRARLIWAWMLARSACSGQVGYTSLEATLAMYLRKLTVTFWALAAGLPRCTVMVSGMMGAVSTAGAGSQNCTGALLGASLPGL